MSKEQLEAGYSFTAEGQYEIKLIYRYLGDSINPPSTQGEIFARTFTINAAYFPHMQRECRIHASIEPGDSIMFFHALSDDGSITCEFTTGEFRLNFCGTCFIKWFVAPQSGLTSEGSNFAVFVNGQEDFAGSSHIKISPAVGFSIVNANGFPSTVRLVNVSDGNISLSQTAQVTAGIIIFRIGVDG